MSLNTRMVWITYQYTHAPCITQCMSTLLLLQSTTRWSRIVQTWYLPRGLWFESESLASVTNHHGRCFVLLHVDGRKNSNIHERTPRCSVWGDAFAVQRCDLPLCSLVYGPLCIFVCAVIQTVFFLFHAWHARSMPILVNKLPRAIPRRLVDTILVHVSVVFGRCKWILQCLPCNVYNPFRERMCTLLLFQICFKQQIGHY